MFSALNHYEYLLNKLLASDIIPIVSLPFSVRNYKHFSLLHLFNQHLINICKKLSVNFFFNDNIYIADNVGFIYSINLKNGNINWIKNHGIPLKSNIKVYENKIILIIIYFPLLSGSDDFEFLTLLNILI